jgi:hypothetical protein
MVTKVSNVVYVGFGDVVEEEEEMERYEVKGDFKMAWTWVEGWRARLRAGGDVVERGRWEECDGLGNVARKGIVVGNYSRS